MKEELFKKEIELITNNLELLANLGDIPNINFQTKVGKVFWNDFALSNNSGEFFLIEYN